VFDEVLLVACQFEPVLGVLAQIDLVHRPEASHLVFVHFPDIFVLNGQDHKAVWVLFQQGFRDRALGVLTLAGCRIATVGGELALGAAVRAVMLVKELRAGHLGLGLVDLRKHLSYGVGLSEEFVELELDVFVHGIVEVIRAAN
jgi:hypothetical protein